MAADRHVDDTAHKRGSHPGAHMAVVCVCACVCVCVSMCPLGVIHDTPTDQWK